MWITISHVKTVENLRFFPQLPQSAFPVHFRASLFFSTISRLSTTSTKIDILIFSFRKEQKT